MYEEKQEKQNSEEEKKVPDRVAVYYKQYGSYYAVWDNKTGTRISAEDGGGITIAYTDQANNYDQAYGYGITYITKKEFFDKFFKAMKAIAEKHEQLIIDHI